MDKDVMWGLTLNIDLYDCDRLFINSQAQIKRYAIEVCKIIEMKRYGDPIIEWFGQNDDVKGFSLVQLIETSSITGHFSSKNCSAYIDIFSCKQFNTDEASEFSAKFFSAKRFLSNTLYRQ